MIALPPALRQTLQRRLERFGYRLVRIPAEQLAAGEATQPTYAAPLPPNLAAPPDLGRGCDADRLRNGKPGLDLRAPGVLYTKMIVNNEFPRRRSSAVPTGQIARSAAATARPNG
jgi:hypothetical protein